MPYIAVVDTEQWNAVQFGTYVLAVSSAAASLPTASRVSPTLEGCLRTKLILQHIVRNTVGVSDEEKRREEKICRNERSEEKKGKDARSEEKNGKDIRREEKEENRNKRGVGKSN